TLIVIFVGEFIPKSMFKLNPNFYFRTFAIPIYLFYILLYPIAKLTTGISYLILRLLGQKVKDRREIEQFDREDLAMLLEDTTDAEHEENEIKLFQNVLEFPDLAVRDCMVPRVDVEAVEADCPIEELTAHFAESQYSRIFVYEDTIDNIIGYVNSKSLFNNPKTLQEVMMKVNYVPETMPLQRLLTDFIKRRSYIAVVIDEFGGTAGIISLEDMLEEIFGEIEDEHDHQDMVEKRISDNEFVLSARLEVEYLNEKYDLGIEESKEYDTLAGYVIYHYEGIPSAGETVMIAGKQIKVLRTSQSRIELVKIKIQTH
ncbi:MAG: HlyC/CorC family transporter, partial [Rikenellaceae bacterium]|nr:HlyC/CorC family transporter [Rikenellaceae bacterium]